MHPAKVCAFALLLLFLPISSRAERTTYTYRINPATSAYLIGGGLTGGIRERGVSGVFKVIVDDDSIRLSNVSVYPATGFPEYAGMINALGEFSAEQATCDGFGDNTYSGELFADALQFRSSFHTCVYDGYGYGFRANAYLIDTADGENPPEGPADAVWRRLRDFVDRILALFFGLLRVFV